MSSVLAWCLLWHIFDLSIPGAEKKSNILAELWSYISDMATFAYIYNGDLHFSKYNLHTWTIPIELRGSMFVFVWIFIMHRVEHRIRIYATIAMVFYLEFLITGAWYACFFGGMLLAEAGLLAADTCPLQLRFVWDGLVRAITRRKVVYSIVLHVLLLAGLWLGSAPADQSMSSDKKFEHCPSWNPLSTFLPPAYAFFSYRWFWFFWGAAMTVTAAQGIGWLRGFFEWRFSQC
jgi:hypothetical protein